MPRGRPQLKMPRVEWRCQVRADIAAQVELLLADPMRQHVKYGARSVLIEALLEKWLAEQRQASLEQIGPRDGPGS